MLIGRSGYSARAAVAVNPRAIAPTKAALANLDTYEAIPWVGMGDVETLVSEKPKKIIVDVYTPWCGPCKLMDKKTFTDAEIINQFGKNFYAVKFNAESEIAVNFKGKAYANPGYDPAKGKNRRNSPHELTKQLNVRAYPTLLVFDEKLEVLEQLRGYKPANALIQRLLS